MSDSTSAATAGECPPSQRADGQFHSWRFDGDDPYIVCVFCDEMRDALNGNVVRPAQAAVVTPNRQTEARRLDLFVPGRPAPQGSKRHVGGGRLIESSKAVAPWRTLVAWHVAQHATVLLDGALAVRLDFVMPRPAATPKRSTPAAIKKPDVDKLTRAIFDALSGVAWRDDSQVVDVHATKRLAEIDEQPGCRIHVALAVAAATR